LKTKQFQPFLGGVSAESVSFSKDGQNVAYVSYPGGILWRANRDGSNPVQLSDPPMHAMSPSWSPDGVQILFDDYSPPRAAKSYIVSSQGGAPRRLLPEDNEEQWAPIWSPDGDKIVFESGGRSDLRREHLGILDLASQKVTVVPGSIGMVSPRWSPDGRYLLAMSFAALPYMRIFDFQTQRWSALATMGLVGIVAYPNWSTDSQFVYFLHLFPPDRGVFRVRAKGGQAERVVDLEGFHLAGTFGRWLGLDPTDAPLILRDVGSNDIYALTLEEK
jgi:eukaryotic-like serine/threonine-protein kinase